MLKRSNAQMFKCSSATRANAQIENANCNHRKVPHSEGNRQSHMSAICHPDRHSFAHQQTTSNQQPATSPFRFGTRQPSISANFDFALSGCLSHIVWLSLSHCLVISPLCLRRRVLNEQCLCKDQTFTSKAQGTRESKKIEIQGRVPFDMFLAVSRDYKLSSYSLNAVSTHFLGDQKEVTCFAWQQLAFVHLSIGA